MAKIVVIADSVDGDAARMTFSERVVAENLLDGHYANQLIERLGWAAADAEALELLSPPSQDLGQAAASLTGLTSH